MENNRVIDACWFADWRDRNCHYEKGEWRWVTGDNEIHPTPTLYNIYLNCCNERQDKRGVTLKTQ